MRRYKRKRREILEVWDFIALSPGNFLCKLLEISSEIYCQCKAGIVESTYKWTNQIKYSNKISLVKDPKQPLC